jgi:S1-C subfamily serine protease
MRAAATCLGALLLLSAPLAVRVPAQPRGLPELVPGTVHDGTLRTGPTDEAVARFTLAVPPGVVYARVDLVSRLADLDLYLVAPAQGVGFDDHLHHDGFMTRAEGGKESVVASRFTETPLSPGRYVVEVVWPVADPPRWEGRRLLQVPFTLQATFQEQRLDDVLPPGVPVSGTLSDDRGRFACYRIDVPDGTEALRLDLSDVPGNVELMTRHGAFMRRDQDHDHAARGPGGRESLVITAASQPPLRPGPWYVEVFEPTGVAAGDTPFTLEARLTADPPERLLTIPPFPPAAHDTPLARASRSVLELTAAGASGSGTLVTPDGLVLTNAHVVADHGGRSVEEVVLAMTLDPSRAPVEMFRGRVLRSDARLDLALVQIERGFYGQPLPDGFRFPAVSLGDDGALGLGDALWVVGYPGTGGQRSRPSLTCVQGVLSGFEELDYGLTLKTDAAFQSGNSGGAALNARGELVAVPTAIMENEFYEALGYMHPLGLLPAEWRVEIDSRRN